MFSIRTKSRNVKDKNTSKLAGSKGSALSKNVDDATLVDENKSADSVRPRLSRSDGEYGIVPNIESHRANDETSVLNIISVESSVQSPSHSEQEHNISNDEEITRRIVDEPGSYSTFQDDGEKIENPTSYMLGTDSDDEQDSLPLHRGPESSNIISHGIGLRSGLEVYQEGVDIKSSAVSNYGISRANRGVSSVYSSQETVKINSESGSESPIIHTPQKFIDKDKYALSSAPLSLTSRRLGSSRAHDAFFSTSADFRESYLNINSDESDPKPPLTTTIHPPKSTSSKKAEPFGSSNLLRSMTMREKSTTENQQSHLPATGNAQQDSNRGWDSAIPALMYSNNIQTGNKNGSDTGYTSRKDLQETLLRGDGSIIGPQTDYLDVIKRSLSKNRSKVNNGPNNDVNKGDSPPLLFSQDRNSISRSMSVRNDNNKGKEIQDYSDTQAQADDNKSLATDEVSIIETLRDGNDKFNIATRETELNCEKTDPRFVQSANYIPPMFKGENGADDDDYDHTEKRFQDNNAKPENNKFHKKGKDGRDDKDHTWEARLRKPVSDKVYSLIIWILIMIILLMICIFVPLLILYSRGTESIVVNYLNNINPTRRSELLQNFYPLGLSNSSSLVYKNSTGTRLPKYSNTSSLIDDNSFQNSVSIAGISKFENIPKKYRRNEEIQEMMNNTALRNVFYGIDYAPRNVIYPICGATLHEVMLDVAQLSQVTSRLRTYGTQCNQAKFILDSIKTLNLNVSLAMGVWIGPNDDINQLQIEDMKHLLKEYPRKYFDAVFIGNEVLFREEQSPEKLIQYISDAKDFIQDELKWDLPVGTSELGPKSNFNVIAASDIYGSNSHPFFTGKTVQLATKWVFDFIKYQIEPMKDNVKSKADIIISEIGWPYYGGKYKKAVAGKRHMQYFLNNWICEAKEKSYPWYFFEAYDEPWKQIYHSQSSKWETEWGLFTADRKLKEGITFPTC